MPTINSKAIFENNMDGSICFDIIKDNGEKFSDRVIERRIDKYKGINWNIEEITALLNFLGVEYDSDSIYSGIYKELDKIRMTPFKVRPIYPYLKDAPPVTVVKVERDSTGIIYNLVDADGKEFADYADNYIIVEE